MSKENIIVKAKDGVEITAVASGFGLKPVKAVVIICHGFGEHAGSYKGFSERLEEAGYASVVPTQRGHGRLSDEPEQQKLLQGIVPSYESFLDDIESIVAAVKEKAPKTPIVLYGHSMGGNIAANYLLKRNQSDFACAVLEAPWLGLHHEVNPVTAAMAKLAGGISPERAIIKKLALSDITSDQAKAEEIGNDPFYHNRISLRMFSGIKSGCAYALKNASRLSIPTWLACAKREAIVSNRKNAEFAQKAGDCIKTTEYNSCHSIHNDKERERFFTDLAAFLDTHCRTEK
jgi:alpha-beta hydrolase superfamily lysophospholipase